MAWKYSTPAHEDSDLPDRIKDLWHARMAGIARDGLLELSQHESDGGIIPFIDPTAPSGVPDQRTPTAVVWPGFPAQVALAARDPQQALSDAEDHGISDLDSSTSPAVEMVDAFGAPIDGRVRHRQDEYLEWEAEHDADGRLAAVTFVAEGHDYWSFLFEHAPQKVARMFQDSTGNRSIQPEDLKAKSDIKVVRENGRAEVVIREGKYNWRHQFNQGPGILHLSHRANSLSAELRLAISSSLGRVIEDGSLLDATDAKRLMCCTQGGEVNRASDPIIGAAAYGAVTDPNEPKLFTLTNPVGLYIRSFNHEALRPPKGQDPITSPDVCTVQRGTGLPDNQGKHGDESRILRLRVAAPKGADYVLGDMTVGPVSLKSGAQLAQLVDMQLFVDVWDSPGPARRVACVGACCIGTDHVLHPVAPTETCQPGLQHAYPELRRTRAIGGATPTTGLLGRRTTRP